MSKVTKGFIITAVVMIVLGLVIAIGAVAAGGLAATETLVKMGKLDYSWSWDWDDNHLHISHDDIFDEGMFDDDFDIFVDDKEETFSANQVKNLDLEIGAGKVEIVNGDTDKIDVRTDNMRKRQIYLDNNTLYVKGINDEVEEGTVYITLPKDTTFQNVILSAGASDVDIDSIQADSLQMELGAGRIDIESAKAQFLKIEVGAGTAAIREADIKDAEVDVAMGQFELDGIISGDLNAECGMGHLVLNIEGTQEEHNYDLECAAGNIDIGNHSYSGLASDREIDNGAASNFDLECSMGNMIIKFTE